MNREEGKKYNTRPEKRKSSKAHDKRPVN